MSRYPSSPQSILDKKNQIFHATRHLLARKDFHALTIDDIAKKAGIAKGTVYLYFKNKESLHTNLVQSLFDELSPRIARIAKSKDSPQQMLRQVMEAQLNFFDQHMDVFVHFFRDRRDSGANQCLKESFRELVDRLSGIVRAGIKRGEFRPVNPVKAALVMMGMVRSCIIERIHGFSERPLSKDAPEIWDIFMNGISQI